MIELDLREPAAREALELEYADGALRERAILNWHGRMVNEYQSHHVFAQLAPRMRAAGFDESLVAECKAFAEEEKRHGALCAAVVHALGGNAVARVSGEVPTLPRYADVSPQEAVARCVLSVCCLSETVAVSLVGAERLRLKPGPLERLLTEIYADEVGHARFGWRFVQDFHESWSPVAKQRLSLYLRAAFKHLEAHELAHISADATEPGDAGHQLGLCNGAQSRELFYDTVTEVIVPGLEQVGLHASEAWERRGLIMLSG
ncbi:MAG: ferritin-like domain-containing protein [Myxococcota bacterium]